MEEIRGNGGSPKSTTDPTELTTQVIWREISGLKELLTSELEALKKATEVAHDDLVRVPTDVQKQVGGLKELMYEKIDSLDRVCTLEINHLKEKFDMVERYRIEQKSDTRTAVDDALKAAKELVFQQNQSNSQANTKTELSFSKLLEQQSELFHTTTNNFNQRIGDIKELLSKSEGKSSGANTLWLIIIALISAAGTIASLITNTQ